MNVVHAVLRNWDILQVITDFMRDDFVWGIRRRDSDLVAVALVCRALSGLALNVLWRAINMDKIYFLFPIDMIRAHPEGFKLLTRAPATPQEWERFDIYASRVRELSGFLLNHLFLHGVRTRYTTLQHPFPNLTCLRWSSISLNVGDAIAIICSTLVEVQLSITELYTDEDEDEDEDHDAVADVLRSLGVKCPRLRKLEHHSFSDDQSKTVEASLIYLISHCRRLEDVHLPVSRDILRALGSLPHLSMLQLDYAMWEDGSQLSLPIQADEWIEEAKSFPVLDHLTIQGSHTVSSLTECFQSSGCFPKKSFTMKEISECKQWSTPAIADFFRGILRPDRSEGLLALKIDRNSAVENPVGHDTWHALRCLSLIPNLRVLFLGGLFLDINDTDLEEIPRIWPGLQTLDLNPPHTDDYRLQISFQGLAHLSTLKNLKSASLALAPDSTVSESMLSPSTSSNSPLIFLAFHGKFSPIPPHVATVFLMLHFPRLKFIKASFDSDEGERENGFKK